MENEIYVSPTTAQLLKDAGFDLPCKMFYMKDSSLDGEWHLFSNTRPQNRNREYDSGVITISAPTLDMAHRWAREQHGWVAVVEPDYPNRWTVRAMLDSLVCFVQCGHFTYDDALEVGLDYILTQIIYKREI